MLRPVRSPRTADLVAAQLRRRIVGEMQDGETLPPESVLMERLDVARQTLREAYRALETEGLLTVRRGVQRWGDHGGVPRGNGAIRAVHDLAQTAKPEFGHARWGGGAHVRSCCLLGG